MASKNLADAVVVITGASSGIGAATALEVARRGGAAVVAGDGAQFRSAPARPTAGNVFDRGTARASADGGFHGRRRRDVRASAVFGIAAAGTAAGTIAVVGRRLGRQRRW